MSGPDLFAAIEPYVSSSTKVVLSAASSRSVALRKLSEANLAEYLGKSGINPTDVCFCVVGSTGRGEALGASDFDLLPVAINSTIREKLVAENSTIRSLLRSALGVDVSEGRDLLGAVSIDDLVALSHIGGDLDNRTKLTQRILILTESAPAGGALPLSTIRTRILDAYAQERAVGHHPLAFCNDVARYYRTVCMDYKGRVETRGSESWCERNVKLRHARKFWYFATLIGVAAIARRVRPDHAGFKPEVLSVLELSPALRLFESIPDDAKMSAGRLLDQYAWYLDFMSDAARRERLKSIVHEDRYKPGIDNPFPSLQWNSKVMHHEMMAVLDRVGAEAQARVLDWFLL